MATINNQQFKSTMLKPWKQIVSTIAYFLLLTPTIVALTMIAWTLADDYIHGKIWYGFKTLSPDFINTWYAWQQYSWILAIACTLPLFGIAIIIKKAGVKRLTIPEAIVIFLIFAIITGMFHPMHRWTARAPYRCYKSKVNMWRIFSAIKTYQQTNGQQPKQLSMLYPTYLTELDIFFSPSGVLPNNDINTEGYNYYPTVKDSDIILTERANTRVCKGHFNGGFILYANGCLEWVSNERLLEITSEDSGK